MQFLLNWLVTTLFISMFRFPTLFSKRGGCGWGGEAPPLRIVHPCAYEPPLHVLMNRHAGRHAKGGQGGRRGDRLRIMAFQISTLWLKTRNQAAGRKNCSCPIHLLTHADMQQKGGRKGVRCWEDTTTWKCYTCELNIQTTYFKRKRVS